MPKKKKLKDYETVALTEEDSAILQRELPQKLKDSRNFTIPYSIGNSTFEKALCDLGENIYLMPLSIFWKLELGEGTPTTVTLQLADHSIKHPRGVIEDELVKVDKFIFPTDFVVLDIWKKIGRYLLFLEDHSWQSGELLSIFKRVGELGLWVQEEKVIFNVFNAIKYPVTGDNCFRIDALDALVLEHLNQPQGPLKTCLIHPNPANTGDHEVLKTTKWMDSFGPNN